MTKSNIIIQKIKDFLGNLQLTEIKYCIEYQVTKQGEGFKLDATITNSRGNESTGVTLYADTPVECMSELEYLCKTYYEIDFTLPIMHREALAPITNQIGQYAIAGQYICKSL